MREIERNRERESTGERNLVSDSKKDRESEKGRGTERDRERESTGDCNRVNESKRERERERERLRGK